MKAIGRIDLEGLTRTVKRMEFLQFSVSTSVPSGTINFVVTFLLLILERPEYSEMTSGVSVVVLLSNPFNHTLSTTGEKNTPDLSHAKFRQSRTFMFPETGERRMET